jgi:PAS domain S-box-containing protein
LRSSCVSCAPRLRRVTSRVRTHNATVAPSPGTPSDAPAASEHEYPKHGELEALQREYPKHGELEAETTARATTGFPATEYPKPEDPSQFAVFDALSDIVCVTTLDGTLRFLNQAGLDLLGVLDLSTLIGCVFPAHTPAARTLLLDEVVPAAVRTGHATGDTALQTVDGRVFPASQTVVVTPATTTRPAALTIVIRDISIERHAAARVRESQRLFEMITRTSPDLLCLYDPADERIVWMNRCPHAFLGGTERDARTLNRAEVTRLVHRDDRAQFHDHAARMTVAYSDIDVLTHDARMRTPGGGWRWIQTRTSVFSRRENGDPLLLLGVATDISARKTTESRLIAARDAANDANQVRADCVARMTHEFRRTLDAIVGRTTEVRLDRDHRLTMRQHAHLDRVLADAMRLLETVSDLDDFSAIDMGLLHVEQQLVDVGSVLRETIAAFADHPQLISTPIELALPATTAPLLTDPKRLREIVTHLIANALTHTRAGWISVTLRVDESDGAPIAIDVDDSGTGIAAERQLSLFQPFERDRHAEPAASDDRATGLGLARARALAESIGCALTLDWSEPGAGASFRVALPVPSRAARLAGVYHPRPTIDVDWV